MGWELEFSPLLPPTKSRGPGGSAPSHQCPVGAQAHPSTFPRGRPAPQRSLCGHTRAELQAAEVKDVRLCSLQRSMLTKDRHAKQLRKPLSQPVPHPAACPPAQRSCSPRGPKASLFASQPLLAGSPLPAGPAPGPMALRKPALGTGTAGWVRKLGLDRLPPLSSPSFSLPGFGCSPS